ncbi:MAG TPA: hypothetical protein DHW71_13430 [Gammaproteobacteria bacterium]|nr:hypothetical protein [Gammaproteobacteria bacterium]HBF08684.1 hypothetical protein [Gammaproteobacteria bacterium]HCK93991.1 hypothetical protein [Gammaproteobacteria bacterium]
MYMGTFHDFISKNSNKELSLEWLPPTLTIQLNRPKRKNALNGDTIKKLKNIFYSIQAFAEIKSIIIEGGEKQFCAGADLQEISEIKKSGSKAIYENNKNFGELLHSIYNCPIPTIALVDGPALGGGMGLACVCDFILCTPNASFGMPEPRLGIIAGQIFPYVFNKLGLIRTQEMALQGLKINGELAIEWQFINSIHDDYTSLKAAAESICLNILQCAPIAIQNTKKLIQTAAPINAMSIDTIAKTLAHATLSEEGLEGNTAFMEKRKPNWTKA